MGCKGYKTKQQLGYSFHSNHRISKFRAVVVKPCDDVVIHIGEQQDMALNHFQAALGLMV